MSGRVYYQLNGERITLANAKRLVCVRYPRAYIKTCKPNYGRAYHLVFSQLVDGDRLGENEEGQSKAHAWKNAAEEIAQRDEQQAKVADRGRHFAPALSTPFGKGGVF